jgi:hypothetical protein
MKLVPPILVKWQGMVGNVIDSMLLAGDRVDEVYQTWSSASATGGGGSNYDMSGYRGTHKGGRRGTKVWWVSGA